MSCRFTFRLCVVLLVGLPTVHGWSAPPATKPKPELPKISEDPKTIDPVTLVSPKLAATATRDFSDSSLREVVAWLRKEPQLVVLLDKKALADIGVSPAEPISDQLNDEPIYLLLNRLRSLGLAWYFEDQVLHITSSELAQEHTANLPYNVGDLLDADYDLDRMMDVITTTVAPGAWEEVGGAGVLNALGDVLFVRQNEALQREVKALLEALRNHGRQTFSNDPSQHLRLRQRLNENVSVEFLDTPLETAIAQLAKIAKIDIRLDRGALRKSRVREREPVTLKIADRKLSTVLRAIVLELDLTWILRDGVVWITTSEQSDEFLKVAVYDVRDLCRDAAESSALVEAISKQTEPDSWDDVGGPGSITFAKPGTLVISHRERIHMEVLDLLETYRTALRSSKPRGRDKEDPDQVITVYYRLHANVARDLSKFLPSLVRPDTWKRQGREEVPGKILVIASVPDLSHGSAASKTKQASPIVVERAVLIVHQTRAAHNEIAEVIRRVKSGDALRGNALGGFGGGGFGGGGGGFGGGGFGGGFFQGGQSAN